MRNLLSTNHKRYSNFKPQVLKIIDRTVFEWMQQNHQTSLLVFDDVIKSAKIVDYFYKNVKFSRLFSTQNTKDWSEMFTIILKENCLSFQKIYFEFFPSLREWLSKLIIFFDHALPKWQYLQHSTWSFGAARGLALHRGACWWSELRLKKVSKQSCWILPQGKVQNFV